MKKLAILLIFSLFGCSTPGKINHAPVDFIIIHGKTYKLMNITVDTGGNTIWIMYPKDSLDSVPQTIN